MGVVHRRPVPEHVTAVVEAQGRAGHVVDAAVQEGRADLPVELEGEKELGLDGKEQIEVYGL